MPHSFAAAAASDEVIPFTGWGQPDPSVLSAGRRAPPAMPSDMFGPVWPMLEDFAQGAGAPVDYVAFGYLAAAASLIGGKRWVQPYAGDGVIWKEPCILWCALVGDPSSNKSPALDRATGALRDLEREHADEHSDRLQGWHADVERAKVERGNWAASIKEASKEARPTPPLPDEAIEPPVPQRRRLLVQDSTPEKLAEILSGNPSGTLHLRDEPLGLARQLRSLHIWRPGLLARGAWWASAYGRSHQIAGAYHCPVQWGFGRRRYST